MEIRKISPDNFGEFFALIVALADFEKLPPPDEAAKARMKEHAFADRPKFEAFLGYRDGKAVAYAIIFETYSSFLAKPTLYLEDIFILPDYRRQGAGKEFFDFLVNVAIERDCGRMEWQVLDWNSPAIGFYEKLGARRMQEWHSYRLTGEDLRRLAGLREGNENTSS